VAHLEQRYGRVTSCRVALKGPSGHHQNGGLYQVNIRLALPNGRQVNIGRTAQADERYADLTFDINDAFKRARRRLQDHVRRLQGLVHDGPPIGTVMRLNPTGEFGFLESGDGREIYFHRNSVLDGGFSRLGRRFPRDLRRGSRREGTAGEHVEVARKARIARLKATLREISDAWDRIAEEAEREGGKDEKRGRLV
jgi:cold shock CspA family protein